MDMLHQGKTNLKASNMFIQTMLIFTLIGGCMGKPGNQKDCLENIIAENKRNETYEPIKKAIGDSIEAWAKKGLNNTSSYLAENSVWKVDEYVFNADKTKLFGWILQINKEQVTNIPKDEDRNDILDYVEYFAGEKINGKWYFYIHNMPGIYFERKDNNSQPYSFEYLSDRAKDKVVEGGIIKNADCALNYKYINEWIDRKGRELHKWHQDFLESGDR